jgi:hypothetical protein
MCQPIDAVLPPRTAATYGDRPGSCRDFTLGSAHCLTARRHVDRSP